MRSGARWWHALTFVVAVVALVLQFVLVWQGSAVLDETDPPALGTRVFRFFCYFTILSNILVALTTAAPALEHLRGRAPVARWWRVLRLNAVVCIAVTGVLHWFLLRPLLSLNGADYVADKLLHVVVPLLAVAGWLLFGPRERLARRDLAPSSIFPALYFLLTLVHGEVSGWYPYPFVDVTEHGYAVVLVNATGVLLLLVALCAGAWWLDPRLPRWDDTVSTRS